MVAVLAGHQHTQTRTADQEAEACRVLDTSVSVLSDLGTTEARSPHTEAEAVVPVLLAVQAAQTTVATEARVSLGLMV